MRKILCLVLALILAVGVVGCSRQEVVEPVDVPSSTPAAPTPKEPCQVALVQYTEDATANTVREAFVSRLDEWGYGETEVTIEYQNASGNIGQLETVCRNFVNNGADMLVAIDTEAAKAAMAAAQNSQTRVLFAAVEDPQGDLGLQSLSSPTGNATGTSDHVPVSQIVELARQADPAMTAVGLLYSDIDTRAVAAAAELKAYCTQLGLTVTELILPHDSSALAQEAAVLCENVQAVFTVAPDSGLAGYESIIAQAAATAKCPWYAGSDAQVRLGATAAVGVDYVELGNKSADMAVQLIAGRGVEQVPVYTFTTYQTYVSQTALEKLSLRWPESILETAAFLS